MKVWNWKHPFQLTLFYSVQGKSVLLSGVSEKQRGGHQSNTAFPRYSGYPEGEVQQTRTSLILSASSGSQQA